MKRSTLQLLCCPGCRAALSLRDERGDETVDEGSLLCPQCERSFLIRNGIAHFISAQELEALDRRFARFYDWFSHVYALFTKLALPMTQFKESLTEPTKKYQGKSPHRRCDW